MEAVSILRFGLICSTTSSPLHEDGQEQGHLWCPRGVASHVVVGKEGRKVVSRQVGLSGNVSLNVQESGWLGFPMKPLQQPPALVQVCGWGGPFAGKAEPIAAVPALAVFQETCPSSSQCL